MSETKDKIYRKVHYMNISDVGGDKIALVGNVKNFNRGTGKLLMDVLGKEFEVSNVDSKAKISNGNIGKVMCCFN